MPKPEAPQGNGDSVKTGTIADNQLMKEREANVGKLETIIKYGLQPMMKEVVKTSGTTTSPSITTGTGVKTSGGFSGFTIDWKKMSQDPFADFSKFFSESEKRYEDAKREAAEIAAAEEAGDAIPMVIVADFTLPYRCCEHYSCEDMCFSDTELANLPIPPFAKDDFVVTRIDKSVDIYPELNDSGLFKNFIVVKEVMEEAGFTTSIGGKVKGVKKGGKRPHFVYTPPKGKSDISDSFPYTLINTANGLTDEAIVWIQIAPLPEAKISLEKNVICFSSTPVDLNVDAPMRDPETLIIEMDGDPESQSVIFDGTSWKLDSSKLSRGEHTLTLKQDNIVLSTYTFTVLKPEADFYVVQESIKVFGGTVYMTLNNTSVDADTFDWQVSELLVHTTYGMEPANLEIPVSSIEKGRIKVTLFARSSQAECTEAVMSEFIAIPQAELSLPDDGYCIDSDAADITIVAQGYDVSKLTVFGPGAEKIGETWKFFPSKVDPGDITLQLLDENGLLLNKLIVTVIELHAEFELVNAFRTEKEFEVVANLRTATQAPEADVFKWEIIAGEQRQEATGPDVLVPLDERMLQKTDYFINVTHEVSTSDPAKCGDVANRPVDLGPFLFQFILTRYAEDIENKLATEEFKAAVAEMDKLFESGESEVSGKEIEEKLRETARITKGFATDPVKMESLTNGTSEQPIAVADDTLKLLDSVVTAESTKSNPEVTGELLDVYKDSLANMTTLLSLSPNKITTEETTRITAYKETLATNEITYSEKEVADLNFAANKSTDTDTKLFLTDFSSGLGK